MATTVTTAAAAASQASQASQATSRVDVWTSIDLAELYQRAGGWQAPTNTTWEGALSNCRSEDWEGAAAADAAAAREAEEAAAAEEAVAISTLAVRRAVGRHLGSLLKVFVVDCDGVLWDGVVSEDGSQGVRFGQGHLALQRALSRLQQRGRLLCLASKNDEPRDVLDVFRRRSGEMALELEQISAWQVPREPLSV
jgi:hypothetical protein